jgi:hypothetical protein
MSDAPDRKPFLVQCGKCQHVWAAAYLPMEVSLFAKAAKAVCPMCGNGPKGIFIPKQHDGVLSAVAPSQPGATS